MQPKARGQKPKIVVDSGGGGGKTGGGAGSKESSKAKGQASSTSPQLSAPQQQQINVPSYARSTRAKSPSHAPMAPGLLRSPRGVMRRGNPASARLYGRKPSGGAAAGKGQANAAAAGATEKAQESNGFAKTDGKPGEDAPAAGAEAGGAAGAEGATKADPATTKRAHKFVFRRVPTRHKIKPITFAMAGSLKINLGLKLRAHIVSDRGRKLMSNRVYRQAVTACSYAYISLYACELSWWVPATQSLACRHLRELSMASQPS